jgi:CBS domain containing-hemolysin-like protein
MILALVVSVLLLAANAAFVALEFALVASRRSALEPLAEDGDRRATAAIEAMTQLNLQLAGAQLGITMASLLLGYVTEPIAVELLEGLLDPLELSDGVRHGIALALGLGVIVFLHMVLGEMVPKNIALSTPEPTLLRLSRSNRRYLTVFRPAIRVLNGMAVVLVRLLGIEPRDELQESRTPVELAALVAESHGEGLIEDFARDLLTGVLDFGDRAVSSVMTPRDEIVWLRRGADVAEAERLLVEHGHSRLPVAGGAGPDHRLGFVHAKDLLALPDEALGGPVPARLVRPALVVPDDAGLERVLRSMRTQGTHLALVRGEAGDTLGLVTLEDLLEELVGDIVDESDPEG